MKQIAFIAILLVALVPVFHGAAFSHAQELPTLDFYYTETCPHCIAEQSFLDDLEEQYPNLEVNRYPITDSEYSQALVQRLTQLGGTQYIGVVPITFVGDTFFIGFDTSETTGKQIEEAVLGGGEGGGYDSEAVCDDGTLCEVEEEPAGPDVAIPFVGTIDFEKYSLPTLAIVLGLLDGFNVCSLGALALILGLALTLGSRKKIALYGGVFVLTTALIYGALIFLWFLLFSTLSQFVGIFEAIIGSIGIIGGLYFLKEYIRMKRFGVTCDSGGLPIIGKLTEKVQHVVEKKGGGLAIAGMILVFAGVVTIVEFPCSAAVPLLFAGILADAGVSTLGQVSYIGLFVLFYLLDELIVFGIAVYKMSMWLSSQKFVIWITLLEAIILITLGVIYLGRIIF